ncbi:MAG: sugar phosphate isomerase/epimerase [Pseudohongiellaceae bacterium]|jgi:sugar phosphate isomerase/epimerase
MKLKTGQHLGYCTNVHPYDDLGGMIEALESHAKPLAGRLGVAGKMGVGLWFPKTVAREVEADPGRLIEALDALGLYVFTVNAFPYGSFHGDRVKDAVFRPSWAEEERLSYTLSAARALAACLPEGVNGTLSTHSGAYKPWGAELCDEDAVVAGLLAADAGLAQLAEETGRKVTLAIEPEPLSFLETTDEVVDLFTRRLLPESQGHLGLCYDACHQAVEFEDMAASLTALAKAGVPIAKVQLSCAIVSRGPAGRLQRLTPFAEDRWFHQVIVRQQGQPLRRLADLPLALADESALAADEWRVHYHVPLFAEKLDDEGLLTTTRPDLEHLLALVQRTAVTAQLEIETYSFGALPMARREALGAVTLLDCLEQEFRWVLQQLGELVP